MLGKTGCLERMGLVRGRGFGCGLASRTCKLKRGNCYMHRQMRGDNDRLDLENFQEPLEVNAEFIRKLFLDEMIVCYELERTECFVVQFLNGNTL